MQKIIIIFSVLAMLLLREECHGQGTVKYTAGISYGFGDPTYTPTGNVSKKYINLTTLRSHTYSGTTWVLDGRGIDVVSGCAAPAYTPGPGQSNIVINNCTLLQNGQGPELYVFDGASWIFINEKNTAPTYTAGTGIDITGTVISNTGDLSNTNEIQNLSLSGQTLGISSGNTVTLPVVAVAAGAGIGVSNSSGTATVTNTAPDQVVSITGAGTNTVTGTYPNFTITGAGGGGVYTGGEGIVVDSPSIRIDTLDRVTFATSPTLPGGIGTIRWNDTDGTLEFGMKGGNVTQQVGQEQLTMVKHADNSGLANGAVVYVVGSDGINKTVRLASADAESTSANTFGVMTEAATGGNKAFCTTFGLVRDLNTSTLTEGAMVWLSSSTAGAMTTTRPTAPNHAVQVGFCIRSHATQGVIFVSVQNGYELGELHDVAISSPTNNQILQYNSAGQSWVNATLSAITGTGVINMVPIFSGINTVITQPYYAITYSDADAISQSIGSYSYYGQIPAYVAPYMGQNARVIDATGAVKVQNPGLPPSMIALTDAGGLSYYASPTNLAANTNIFANAYLKFRVFKTGELLLGGPTLNAAAKLDVTSTTQGVLFPRMTATQRDAIASPPDGLVVYNTTAAKLQVRAASAWVDLH